MWSEDRTLCGFEALARWQDPKYGNMSPGVFVPVLEEYRLIQKLDMGITKIVFQLQGGSEHQIAHHRLVREKIEILENQAEMQALCTQEPIVILELLLRHLLRRPVVQDLIPDRDGAFVRKFQEIQTTKEGGLAATRRTDDGNDLALFQ